MYISKRHLLVSSVSCIFIISFPCKRFVVYNIGCKVKPRTLWKVHRSSPASLPVNPFNENGHMMIAETQATWVPTGLDFEFRCVCVRFLWDVFLLHKSYEFLHGIFHWETTAGDWGVEVTSVTSPWWPVALGESLWISWHGGWTPSCRLQDKNEARAIGCYCYWYSYIKVQNYFRDSGWLPLSSIYIYIYIVCDNLIVTWVELTILNAVAFFFAGDLFVASFGAWSLEDGAISRCNHRGPGLMLAWWPRKKVYDGKVHETKVGFFFFLVGIHCCAFFDLCGVVALWRWCSSFRFKQRNFRIWVEPQESQELKFLHHEPFTDGDLGWV